MAKPAFIYAFDNIDDQLFVEICGLLLGARYKGFLLGGVGADGGIDGEVDTHFGEWQPESSEPLLNEIVDANRLVIFQFKHIVVARAGGQAATRKRILDLYKSKPSRQSELASNQVRLRKPDTYVLITNIEVNSEFRQKFIEQCKIENTDISNYQIIGLDELELWLNSDPQLGHLYFPTIFGSARFNLKIKIQTGFVGNLDNLDTDIIPLLQVSIMNIGLVTSFFSSLKIRIVVKGESKYVVWLKEAEQFELRGINPKPGTAIPPGKSITFHFPFQDLVDLKIGNDYADIVEVLVQDEIDNSYIEVIPTEILTRITEGREKQ